MSFAKYSLVFNKLAKHRNWHHRKRRPLSDAQRYWLRGNQSLTKQLIKLSQDGFKLQMVREVRMKPYAHESRFLGLPLHRSCLVREVLLFCQGKPVVFARSVISDKAMKASKHQLTKLGTIPLGHLLFNHAKVDLETRQLARILISACANKKEYFARRTLYKLNGENILVAEFFLSPLW